VDAMVRIVRESLDGIETSNDMLPPGCKWWDQENENLGTEP